MGVSDERPKPGSLRGELNDWQVTTLLVDEVVDHVLAVAAVGAGSAGAPDLGDGLGAVADALTDGFVGNTATDADVHAFGLVEIDNDIQFAACQAVCAQRVRGRLFRSFPEACYTHAVSAPTWAPTLITSEHRTRLARIRLLCLDVDGVLSDGHLYWSESGWWQRFSVRDGIGLKLLREAGVEVAIISAGEIRSARARAESLQIQHAFFGVKDKLGIFETLATQLGLEPTEAAYIGDELEDLPLLRHVGFSATVPEAVDEVRSAVHYVTRRPGGSGAVRELADLIRLIRANRKGADASDRQAT